MKESIGLFLADKYRKKREMKINQKNEKINLNKEYLNIPK